MKNSVPRIVFLFFRHVGYTSALLITVSIFTNLKSFVKIDLELLKRNELVKRILWQIHISIYFSW